MDFKEIKEKLTYDSLKKTMLDKGYKFFESGDYDVNVFGIRLKTDTNEFDDALGVAYMKKGKKVLDIYTGTTDPGLYWLKNPLNAKGAAILAPGQYLGAYRKDLHQGKYSALCQKSGTVKVFRDNNRDEIHDMTMNGEGFKGFFGINIHRSNPYTESYKVGKWSAGCQVYSKVKDFDKFMDVIGLSAAIFGNKFSYTLLEASDFEKKKKAPVKSVTPATKKKAVKKKPIVKKVVKKATKKIAPKKKATAKIAAKKKSTNKKK